MKKVLKQAVSGLIVQKQEILLIKREQQPYQNMWTLPGGKVEVGESLEDALKREILEEVGLIVKVMPVTYVQVIQNYQLTTSVCEIVSVTTPKEKIISKFFQFQDFFQINQQECTPQLQVICRELLVKYGKL